MREELDDLVDLTERVCRWPQGYTLNGTFGEIAALLTGAVLLAAPRDAKDELFATFNHFVTARLMVPSKFWWGGAIRMLADGDDDAIRRLRDLFVEFLTMRASHTLDEIRLEAEDRVSKYEETEPSLAFRRFMAARYVGDQAELERSMLPHPDASILWKGSVAPPDIAEQLISISDSYVAAIVGGSLDSGRVQLITELGKIDVHLIDGVWRIDASPFIALEKKKS